MGVSAIPVLACLVLAYVYGPPSAQKHAVFPLREDQGICAPSDDHHRLVVTLEKINEEESAPYRVGGDWAVDRTYTVVGKCSYHMLIGGISTQSYSLPAFPVTNRVTICKGDSAIAPYRGPCPPQ